MVQRGQAAYPLLPLAVSFVEVVAAPTYPSRRMATERAPSVKT